MSTTESAVGELTEYVLIESKSPGRLAWERFRRDRVAVTASFVVLFFVGIALFAPLVCKALGINPLTLDRKALNDFGLPNKAKDICIAQEPSLQSHGAIPDENVGLVACHFPEISN